MSSFFNENNINEKINSSELFIDINYSSTPNKKYLSQKRKRSANKLEDNIKSIEKIKKKIIKNSPYIKIETEIKIEKKKNKEISRIKFQKFSKNIIFIISSYLRIDDLLKLKNIGSHNIRLYMIELLKIMKNDNFLILNEKESLETPYMNEYDSLLSKKYFLMNKYSNKNKFDNNNLNIKYFLYHKETNKNYFIIHNILHNYFCSIEVGEKSANSNWENNIIFKLPDKNYYEKFQFIDKFKFSEVAIFSLNKILFYNIFTKEKDYCINLNSSFDYILYKKETNLFIMPKLSMKEIVFFNINNSYNKILKSSYKLIIGGQKYKNSSCDIINITDYIDNENFKNLICVYCSGDKKIILFDCKFMKTEKEIITISNIIKVNISKEFFIVYTEDKFINYYSISNKEYILVNSFNLYNISPINNIKYISFINSKLLENTFILLIQCPNKSLIKPYILYLELTSDINNFYYSLIPLGNNICNSINDEHLIYTTLTREKLNGYDFSELKMVIGYLNNFDDIKIKNNNKGKKGYLIKQYSVYI